MEWHKWSGRRREVGWGVGVKLGERGGEFDGVRENSGRTLSDFGWGRAG